MRRRALTHGKCTEAHLLRNRLCTNLMFVCFTLGNSLFQLWELYMSGVLWNDATLARDSMQTQRNTCTFIAFTRRASTESILGFFFYCFSHLLRQNDMVARGLLALHVLCISGKKKLRALKIHSCSVSCTCCYLCYGCSWVCIDQVVMMMIKRSRWPHGQNEDCFWKE